MSRPDLMICWIKHCDYPLFRRFLRKHRSFFGKIIIYWSEHFRHMYYDKFIQQDLELLGDIEFVMNVNYKYGEEDWRDIATNIMLKRSNSEWVCSIEQDWFSRDWETLLKNTESAMKTKTLTGWLNETRSPYFHPAYFFIKRELLEKTSKDFSPHPEISGSDHFAMVTYDSQKRNIKIEGIENLGNPKPGILAFHLGGVNQNYLEALKPEYVFYRPDWFYIYNYWSMKAEVEQSPAFADLMQKVHDKLKVQLPDLNPETDPRSIYFK